MSICEIKRTWLRRAASVAYMPLGFIVIVFLTLLSNVLQAVAAFCAQLCEDIAKDVHWAVHGMRENWRHR